MFMVFVIVSWMMSIYGFNFYYLFFLSLKNENNERIVRILAKSASGKGGKAIALSYYQHNDYPKVTIQLPIYNEKYVVRRLIKAVCSIDYPKDRLEIQVLDDSTDETREICSEIVEYYRSKGYDIVHITRNNRKGYKAGALKEGLKIAKGEFIAIFDADFIPPPWFLKRVMPYFNDERIGLVQCRWGHVNEDYSTLTQAQALSLDFHFIVEQKAKSLTHIFMNFNGTAGVWRKRCIEDSGGWHVGTLVEDLDLSYRAQMRGWKCIFLDDVVVDAELPVQINAAKRQQYRWAKGSIQCALKLLDKILLSKNLPLDTKIQAFIQLTRHIVHPLLLIQYLLLPLLIAINYNIYPISTSPISPLLVYIIFGPAFYIYIINRLFPGRVLSRLKSYFFLTLFFTGISVSNTIAVFDALLGSKSVFHRTPKFGITRKGEDWRGKDYVLPFTKTTLLEMFFAAYGILGIFISIFNGNAAFAPILAIQAAGFLYIAVLSIAHSVNIGKSRKNNSNDDYSIDKIGYKDNNNRFMGEQSYVKVNKQVAPDKAEVKMNRYKVVLGGILALLIFGVVMAYVGYASTVYPLEKARGYLRVAITSPSPTEMLDYIVSVEALIPEQGNPVWVFPTAKTDFALMHKSIDGIKERLRILSVIPKDSEAFNTGIGDVRAELATLERNIEEAIPYVYVSFQNVIMSAIWVTVIMVIFAVMKRGKARIERFEEMENESMR
jgi:cellulose synthase/poly-beta-1,6-N-acetylglucosamine synthase-like glycosyltransferase